MSNLYFCGTAFMPDYQRTGQLPTPLIYGQKNLQKQLGRVKRSLYGSVLIRPVSAGGKDVGI